MTIACDLTFPTNFPNLIEYIYTYIGIEGIPMPELGHQIYGHPQYLIHHFRHHFRLQLFEKSPNVPVMQFVLPGIKSVFINSAVESGFALQGDKLLEFPHCLPHHFLTTFR